MVILLPNEIDGLAALEQKLPELDLKEILHRMRREEVEVSLPKFKLEKFIDLNDALKKVGYEPSLIIIFVRICSIYFVLL
jgi:serpin B